MERQDQGAARRCGRSASLLLGLAGLALLGSVGGALAQVTLDGSANPGFAGPLDGPDYQIRAELGRRAGRNLFHSFERFDLRTLADGTIESATFSGPDAIRNVISRVTGGDPSDINGVLRSTIDGADFFFLNPAGVMFGPNASVDLRGAFHVSTADELRFADGERFSARLGGASSFSVAPPETFGFLADDPAGILVERNLLVVPDGETLSLVGGDILVSNSAMVASGGRLELVSADAPGEEALGADAVGGDTGAERGAVTLTDALLDVDGLGGGRVAIRAGEVVIERSFISTASFADGNSAGVSIAGDEVRLDRSLVGSSAFAQGNAGPIVITAERLELDNGSFITSSAFSTGDGGDIALSVGSARIVGGSSIVTDTAGPGRSGDMSVTATEDVIVTSRATTFSNLSVGTMGGSTGPGGRLTIRAPRVEVQEGGIIDSGGFGAGDAGVIELAVRQLLVSGGGSVRASVVGSGAAGDVAVVAKEAVFVTGRGEAPSEIAATALFGTGSAGRITITAPRLEVSDGAVVGAPSVIGGPGAGSSGAIAIMVDTLAVTGGADITASSFGSDPGGDLTVSTGELVRISDDGSVAVFAAGAGDGGRIRITAPVLEIDGRGSLAAATLGPGAGGTIALAVGRLAVTDSGLVTAVAAATPAGGATGRAGDLTVDAEESVTISGSDSRLIASTDVGTFGNGGSIRVVAPVVVIQDGGAISARSRGAGQAGSIAIAARSQLEMDEGAITTESEQSGGGQITLRVGRLIDLRDSSIESSVARLAGNAGDIMIDPDFLVLDNSFILARANAGRGGNIRISADQLVVSPDSGINAEAGAEGIDGNVEINAPEEDTTGALVILDAPLLDAASLLRQRCAARRDIGASSFTGVGRGGLPPSPDGPLLSAYVIQARPAATVETGEPAAAPGAVTLVLPCRGPA